MMDLALNKLKVDMPLNKETSQNANFLSACFNRKSPLSPIYLVSASKLPSQDGGDG